MDKIKRRLLIVLSILTLSFTVLIVYLNIFVFAKGESYKKLSYNRRNIKLEQSVKRGKIIEKNGIVLADTIETKSGYKRTYNYPKTYSHIVGYYSIEYGKSGLEQTFNNSLIGLTGTSQDEIAKLTGIKEGNNIKLSIDHNLQVYARESLINKKGAIISMDLKTGDILCMASYPDFNSLSVAEDWKALVERKDAPLLNRATQGLYEPGSIFKIITTDALLSVINRHEKYNSTGVEVINGYRIRDALRDGYGKINLDEAFIHSSNTYYAKMSQKLSDEDFKKSISKYRLDKVMEFDLPVKKNYIKIDNLSETEKVATAIGQGEILVTPLSMLGMVSIVANEGVYIKPRLVNAIVSPDGKTSLIPVVKEGKIEGNYSIIKDMMKRVVSDGTGKRANIKGVEVAGKTGTAENSTGNSHAWFVGFAPLYDPKVAVCVLLEEERATGGVAAAPIAKTIIEKSLKILNEEE